MATLNPKRFAGVRYTTMLQLLVKHSVYIVGVVFLEKEGILDCPPRALCQASLRDLGFLGGFRARISTLGVLDDSFECFCVQDWHDKLQWGFCLVHC